MRKIGQYADLCRQSLCCRTCQPPWWYLDQFYCSRVTVSSYDSKNKSAVFRVCLKQGNPKSTTHSFLNQRCMINLHRNPYSLSWTTRFTFKVEFAWGGADFKDTWVDFFLFGHLGMDQYLSEIRFLIHLALLLGGAGTKVRTCLACLACLDE